MLLSIPELDDPVQRFVSVVKFYLSGWHIRPPGVKKPLNPILGEIYTCYWDLPDGKRAYYVSEQTSHHPPKSSYFYEAPHHHIRIDGTLKPRSKFLGNSAASLMEGIAVLTLTNRGKDPKKGERYYLTQPNMYARGILLGPMKYELGDHSVVRCPELGLTADIEFKMKGWVGGTYNAIGGVIKNDQTGQQLFELSGLWSEEMFIKDLRTHQKEMFFNALRERPSEPQVRPLEEQDERESVRLWQKTAKAVKENNHQLATDEKTKIEDMQREEAAKRAEDGVEWHPRLFRRVKGGPGGVDEGMEDLEWIINHKIDGSTPEKITEQVMNIYPIIPGQKVSERNFIPPRMSSSSARDVLTAGKPAATAASNDNGGGADLIDFGQDDDVPEPAAVPATTTGTTTTGSQDISDMLQATGTDAIGAEGPLIDFTSDMKQDLPKPKAQGQNPPPDMKRAGSSNDAFFDARE